MILISKIIFYIKIYIVNKILKGTHFFEIKKNLLKSKNIILGKNVKIVGPIDINYNSELTIGDNTWIGKNFTIDGNGKTIIGKNCDIAPNVTIVNGSHIIGSSERRAGEGINFKSFIGDGTWIGSHVLILNGATIEKSCVVAARSTIIKDVKENTLVGGSPAQIIRKLDLK